MRSLRETSDRLAPDRLSDRVSAAAYGSVLVLAALSVIGVAAVTLGYGVELVTGVGLATWAAHLFAELLGGHVQHREPLRRSEVRRAMVDGSPILASTVLPATVLLLGRSDLMTDKTARIISIVVATLQLLSIGVFVARVAPARPAARWSFALVTAGIGIAVVALTVQLGH